MLDRIQQLWARACADDELRGLWLVPFVAAGYASYRFFPMPFLALVNLAGALAVILALHSFRIARIEAVGTGLLLLLVGVAAVLGADLPVARVMLGGLFLIAAISTLAAWRDSEQPLDGALALGISSEFALWFAGNAARGTLGSSEIMSVIGMAYGYWAYAGQIAFIGTAYGVALAWRHVRSA